MLHPKLQNEIIKSSHCYPKLCNSFPFSSHFIFNTEISVRMSWIWNAKTNKLYTPKSHKNWLTFIFLYIFKNERELTLPYKMGSMSSAISIIVVPSSSKMIHRLIHERTYISFYAKNWKCDEAKRWNEVLCKRKNLNHLKW